MKNPTRIFLAGALALAAALFAYSQATIYNQPANAIAQHFGGPGASPYIPTFAATITISPIGVSAVQFKGVNTTSSTCTVSAGDDGNWGQQLITVCSADSTGTVTYTFSSAANNFLPTGTVVATASKSISVLWWSDGSVWHEVSRSASAQ